MSHSLSSLFGAMLIFSGCYAAYVVAGRWERRWPDHAAWLGLPVLCAALLCMYLAWHPSVAFAWFPFSFYYDIRFWGVVPCVFLLRLGVEESRRQAEARKRHGYHLMLAVIVLLMVPFNYIKDNLPSGVDPEEARIAPGGYCKQTTGYSCTAAATATLLRQLGIPATEAEMAEACRTTPHGTITLGAAYGLQTALRSSPYRVVIRELTWDDLRELNQPCLTSVWLGTWLAHSVCVLDMAEDGRSLRLWDPLRGEIRMPREAFEKEWLHETVIVTPMTLASAD